MKKSFIGGLVLIMAHWAYTQTGPGGVGNSTSNALWLRSSDISQGDGTAIASWPDQSGNNNHATQATGTYQPTYETNEIYSHGVVRFDGTDDYFDDARAYSARTVFSVYRELSANQQTTDLAQLWGSYNEAVHLALDARNTPGTWSMDGNGATTGRLGLNGAAFGGFAENPSTPNWVYDQFDLVTAEFNSTRSLTRQVIGSLVPSFGVGAHQFGGDLAEIIVYNTTLNAAQRIIVENYLAAKYNLSILNDRYAYQLTHPHEVAGIGRVSAGNENTSAMSSGILRIEGATSLDDGDYLLFGHDDGSIDSWSSTESPDGTYIQRLEREWILNETGDAGNVNIVIDIDALPAQPVSHNMYALLVDADGDFSSGASVYELVLSAGTEYSITGLDIADGQYISIASMTTTVNHSLASSSGSETVDASIEVELNYIPQNDVTVDFTTADGTATVADSDYTPATPGTITIVAPATSNSYTILINNDVDIESTETFTVTLSNPSFGEIGDRPVHTYGIEDDDNPRKIYFDLSASSGLESVTSGNLAVSINMIDGSNVTSVEYLVTGGSAIGGGTDFTLAAGTLNIPSGSSTNNIPFTINDDVLFELDETFIVTLFNPVNCNLDNAVPLGGTGFITHTYTILNDETAPVIQFNTTNSSGDEALSPAIIQVDLSEVAGVNVTANYSVSGTATGGGIDHSLTDGVVTIPAGSTSANISAVIIDDTIEELSETIVITLSGPSNATLGANTIHTYIINDNDAIGKDGPGGVGETDNLVLWLKADDIDQADVTAVSNWQDQSGNGHNASQGTGGNQPVYRTGLANGHAVVRFDGVNDFLLNAYTYDARTVFVVYRMLSANQDTGDLAQVWGSYGDGVHVALDARSGGGRWSFDGNSSNTAKFGIDGASYGTFSANPTSPQWTYDAFEMVAVEFDANRTVTSQAIGSLINVAGHFLGADMAELIVYNLIMDEAQRHIIENYLAAKYSIPITTDLYAYDAPGNHEHEVAGIGRININNFHIDAQGTGTVRIMNANDLDDDEFLLWGHDNGDPTAIETTDVPLDTEARLEKTWRVSEVNSAGTSVDVGTIDILFDLTGLGPVTVTDLRLLVDTNDDGLFADETSISGATSFGGNVYGFTGVSAIEDGRRFTLGTSNVAQTTLPIVLVDFTARLNENHSVELKWETASEINNEYFTIERSRDGIEWMELARVAGAGHSSQHLTYQSTDRNPIFGVSYYRLKQTDFDGQFAYSEVEVVQYYPTENPPVLMYPNPTGDHITITGKASEISTVKLYNISGLELTPTKKRTLNEGTMIVIDLTFLSPGIYLLKTTSGSRKIYKE